MKTTREWLNELPEPYRSEALENCDADLDGYEANINYALSSAFDWYESPQGFDYWNELDNSL